MSQWQLPAPARAKLQPASSLATRPRRARKRKRRRRAHRPRTCSSNDPSSLVVMVVLFLSMSSSFVVVDVVVVVVVYSCLGNSCSRAQSWFPHLWALARRHNSSTRHPSSSLNRLGVQPPASPGMAASRNAPSSQELEQLLAEDVWADLHRCAPSSLRQFIYDMFMQGRAPSIQDTS